MRIQSPATSRAAYYDRGPVSVTKVANLNPGAVAQGDAERWTHTVTAGKKAFVELLDMEVNEGANVATNGFANGAFKIDGATTLQVFLPTGAQKQVEHKSPTGALEFPAGTILSCNTLSNNTAAGSDVRQFVSMKLTEFSA